jgi:hypothetical protein
MDDMMLYNSKKQLSNSRPRYARPASEYYSPRDPQRYDRRAYFDEQDYIRDQVNKIWFKHDINRSGALDKVETANFLREWCAQQGKPSPNLKSFQRFFYEFDKNRDGLIQR